MNSIQPHPDLVDDKRTFGQDNALEWQGMATSGWGTKQLYPSSMNEHL